MFFYACVLTLVASSIIVIISFSLACCYCELNICYLPKKRWIIHCNISFLQSYLLCCRSYRGRTSHPGRGALSVCPSGDGRAGAGGTEWCQEGVRNGPSSVCEAGLMEPVLIRLSVTLQVISAREKRVLLDDCTKLTEHLVMVLPKLLSKVLVFNTCSLLKQYTLCLKLSQTCCV